MHDIITGKHPFYEGEPEFEFKDKLKKLVKVEDHCFT